MPVVARCVCASLGQALGPSHLLGKKFTLASHQYVAAPHKCILQCTIECPYMVEAPIEASPHSPQPMDTTVNQEFGKQAFDQAEKLFKDARVPENVQAIAQQGVAASKELYSKAAAAAQDGAKAMNEIADTAWGSTKMLNEKIAQNLTANAEAAFSAAQAIANAKSLPEIAKLQSEFVQKFAAQATEQTKELFDLSTRATQHLFEKAQSAATKSFKPTF